MNVRLFWSITLVGLFLFIFWFFGHIAYLICFSPCIYQKINKLTIIKKKIILIGWHPHFQWCWSDLILSLIWRFSLKRKSMFLNSFSTVRIFSEQPESQMLFMDNKPIKVSWFVSLKWSLIKLRKNNILKKTKHCNIRVDIFTIPSSLFQTQTKKTDCTFLQSALS